MDASREFTSDPMLRSSLDRCETFMAWIWNRAIYESWPRSKHVSGAHPTVDLLAFRRSRCISYPLPSGKMCSALTSGSLGWGGGDARLEGRAEMHAFAHAAIKLAMSMHTGILAPLGRRLDQIAPGGVGVYMVGPAAARLVRERSEPCPQDKRRTALVSGVFG